MPSPVLAKLWDNLFYQIVSQKSFYTKELIMQLLLANHVLNEMRPVPEDSDYTDFPNARIVLPPEMFLNETESDAAKPKPPKDNQVKSFPTHEMKKKQENALSHINIRKAETLQKELDKLDKKYHKRKQEVYDQEIKDYQVLIKPILDNYYSDVEEERQRWCSLRDPKVPYNPHDPCNQPNQLPFPELPEFVFVFPDEIDYRVLQTDLTPDSFKYLTEVLGLLKEKPVEDDFLKIFEGYNTYQDLYKVIDEATSGYQKLILDNTELWPLSYKNFGGMLVPVSRAAPMVPNTYQLCVKNVGTQSNLDLAVVLPDTDWYVAAISYKIHSGNQDYIGTQYDGSYQTGDSYRTEYLSNLFGDGLANSIISGSDYFEATLWLSTGAKIELHITDLELRSCISGNFKITDGTKDLDFIPNKFGYRKLGIADYKKVEQTVQCYVAGEISQIENVMASEFREKSTRRLRRSEDMQTTSSEMEREQLTDTTSVARFEMQSEVAKLLLESRDLYANTSFNASYGGSGSQIMLGANAGFASHTTKEDSIRQAMTTAQEITERALDRIVTKVREERVIKITEEFEENYKHGYDNRKTAHHISGVYRWVDKLYKNQIINYGKRLMFEFMIPQPAKLHLLGLNATEQEVFDLIAPPDPRIVTDDYYPIKQPSDVYLDNANFWAGWYNVELPHLPDEIINISKGFAYGQDKVPNPSGETSAIGIEDKIEIPEGYRAIRFYISGQGKQQGSSFGRVNIANYPIESYMGGFDYLGTFFSQFGTPVNPPVTRELSISAAFDRFYSFGFGVVVKCERTGETFRKWQIETFNAIIAAYEEKRAEYNEKKKAFEEESKNREETKVNPGFYRKIENMVLRKNCISYMMDRTEGSIYKYGREGMYLANDFMNLEVNTDSALDTYASFVKFMEQAFEWENISYHFYPYYWGNKYDWKKMYNTAEGDPLFNSFLQSGMARVIAPVRPGFEEAVQFYLATGLIWNGGQIPTLGDPLYLSIVDELREIKGEPEGKAWITRVPTALTILQAGTIGLEVDKALPCNCDDKDEFEDPSEVPCDNGFRKQEDEPAGEVLNEAAKEKVVKVSGDN